MAEAAKPAAERQGPLRLDLTNRSVTWSLGPDAADPAAARFVEVEIAEVANPGRIRLTFEVRFQPSEGEGLLLGTFAPFPPDNPGTFLVATRGRLRRGGALVLSMQVLDEVGPEDRVAVTVGRISLLDG